MFLLIGDGFFAGALEYLSGWFGRFHYLGPFIVLLLCGIGFPLPEEFTLILCGVLLHQGDVEFVAITLVCSAAILLGDSIPYWLGRHYGLAALKRRWVAKILHPERFAQLERKFSENGNWAIFTCRFLPGLRIPGYFTAGTLRMSYLRFMLLDSLGVLVSVPTSIWIAKWFGGTIEAASGNVSKFNKGLMIGIAVIVAGVVITRIVRKRRRTRLETARLRAEAAAGAFSGIEAAPQSTIEAAPTHARTGDLPPKRMTS